ncbi:hypothetical protein PR202_ga13930 [Eleusine coracana subsp. coracana]|uniref:Pentatricopeptide repeat-containing protein n=1 Tax=Eleusine coracana subsp. coracana TaxID=191504 RepID=A0AAV5CFU9_ELECO|nr:hypothetical protein PR202_ga13930 [Eleusine coracana subsp. coracana]
MASPVSAAFQRHAAVATLRAASAARDLSKGMALHARLILSTPFNIVLHNHLIAFYAKCGRLGLARKVFDAMPFRNSVSGNFLMSGYISSGHHRDALGLLRVIDFGMNEYVLSVAVSATAHIRSYDMGKQCHGYAIKAGLAEQPYVTNAMLHMYCQCTHMEDAMKIFENVSGFNAFAFNSMINGFLDRGKLDGSVMIVRSMAREVEQWDHVSYVTVLGHCASMKDLVLGVQVHAQALKRRLELKVYVGSALVDMYGKCDCAHDAHCVFEVLREKNVVSWTAIMNAYSQKELFEDALQLFLDMEMSGVRPNEITYAVALNNCAGLAALRTGSALSVSALKTGYWRYLPVSNALINMYSKSGSIKDAWKVFTSMPYRDVVSWNLIITGYAHHGLAREAMEAFHYMLSVAEVPSYVTFVGVLSACAQLGLVDEGFYYLNTMMKEVGVIPGKEHYTCMVYRNYGLGHRVAEQILQLKPNDVGTYVLLSNMYAKANRWDGVVKVRKLMRNMGVRKEPGVSWIQVGSEVHVFRAEDKEDWRNFEGLPFTNSSASATSTTDLSHLSLHGQPWTEDITKSVRLTHTGQISVKKRRRTTKMPCCRSIVGASIDVIKKITEKPEINEAYKDATLLIVYDSDEVKARLKAEKGRDLRRLLGRSMLPKAGKGPKLGGGGGSDSCCHRFVVVASI